MVFASSRKSTENIRLEGNMTTLEYARIKKNMSLDTGLISTPTIQKSTTQCQCQRSR